MRVIRNRDVLADQNGTPVADTLTVRERARMLKGLDELMATLGRFEAAMEALVERRARRESHDQLFLDEPRRPPRWSAS